MAEANVKPICDRSSMQPGPTHHMRKKDTFRLVDPSVR